MRVLITGASGFLGSHLVEVFLGSSHQVRALVRNTSRTERLEELDVELIHADMKDAYAVRRAVLGMDAIVHAASTMAGTPQEFIETTVKGTRNLLNAAAESGVKRFIYIGSISVYALSKAHDDQVITEDFPLETDPDFLGNYVSSKVEAERAAMEFTSTGRMKVFVLRPGLLYGPRGKWNLPRMGYSLGTNRYLVVGRGNKLLPVCYVRNCARAALAATENIEAKSGICNIVDDECFTQTEYLRRLKRDVRPALKIIRAPYSLFRLIGMISDWALKRFNRPGPIRPAHLVACTRQLYYSNDRAKEILGWRPAIGKAEALDETMHYYGRKERMSRCADLNILARPLPDAPPVTVCIAGCGAIAETHLGILNRMPHATVVGLCDVNRDAARALAQKFGVLHAYDDVQQMLETEKPKALHVLTPTQSHATIAELAFQYGCNILMEKPMAMNANEGRRMKELAEKHGAMLCVDHNHLYDPVAIQAKRLVESGALGDILWVESYYGFDLGNNPANRYMLPGSDKHWTFQMPGGLYQNLAPHPLCLALEFLGPPTSVQAHARYGHVLPHAATDELRILLETAKAGGIVTISLATSPSFRYLNIYGTRMCIFVDLQNKWLIPQGIIKGIPKPISRALMNFRHGGRIIGGTLVSTIKGLRKQLTPYDGMEVLIRDFHASIQEKRDPPVTADEAILVMEVMDKVWEQIGSTATGQRPQESPHP